MEKHHLKDCMAATEGMVEEFTRNEMKLFA